METLALEASIADGQEKLDATLKSIKESEERIQRIRKCLVRKRKAADEQRTQLESLKKKLRALPLTPERLPEATRDQIVKRLCYKTPNPGASGFKYVTKQQNGTFKVFLLRKSGPSTNPAERYGKKELKFEGVYEREIDAVTVAYDIACAVEHCRCEYLYLMRPGSKCEEVPLERRCAFHHGRCQERRHCPGNVGGPLLECTNCRAEYHPQCVGLQEVPTRDWFCSPLCALRPTKKALELFEQCRTSENVTPEQVAEMKRLAARLDLATANTLMSPELQGYVHPYVGSEVASP